jgi:hypothetical protein
MGKELLRFPDKFTIKHTVKETITEPPTVHINTRLYPSLINHIEKPKPEKLGSSSNLMDGRLVMKKAINQIIFSPDSGNFTVFSESLMDYLDQNGEAKTLEAAGIDTLEAEKTAYRKAQDILNNPTYKEQSTFYTKLINCIEGSVEKRKNPAVLTINDVISFLKKDDSNRPSPTLSDNRRLIRQILPKLKTTKYEIVFLNIPLDKLKTPKIAMVSFPTKENNDNFSITFYYDENQNRNSELRVAINMQRSKNKAIDWQFLEDPNDSRMGKMKDAIMFSIFSVLGAIKNDVEFEATQEKLKKMTISTIPGRNRSIKLKTGVHVPKEEIKQEDKPKPPEILTPIKIEQKKKHILIEKNESRGCIILPENIEALRPDFIDEKKWENLTEKMRAGRIGRIKPLKGITTIDKEKIFRLNMDGENRILVTKPNHRGNGKEPIKGEYKYYMALKRSGDYKELKK